MSQSSDQGPVRLSPPPRIDPLADRPPNTKPSGARPSGAGPGSARGSLYWLTAIAFLVLAAVALAVFVYLPGWVSERSTAARMTASEPGDAETGEGEVSAVPEAVTVPPVASQPLSSSHPSIPEIPNPPTPPVETPSSEPIDPAESAFAQAMAKGLTHLEEGELDDARRSFEQAGSLSPASPEAADGLARVEAARQLVAIADHQERAVAFEEQERWGEAAAEYAAVLALDPAIRFAQEGRARSSARHELSEELESHIARPDRLSSDRVLDEARRLLVRARALDAPGPVLQQQIERLDRQVAIASTPIRVVLLSDGLTDVLVYRFGRLGVFERMELDLRPGSYTVVGTRQGYRDIRRQLEVAPGGATPSLTVRCEEKI